MFLFQMQAEKKEEDEKDERRLGMKAKRAIGEAASENSLSVLADGYSSMLQGLLKDKDVSDFITTLTPGAQNAIRASSFAWGYENAAKYVKNAMKLDEVKNAADAQERSRAVIESVQQQAGGQKTSEVSKFVWSYYNEDMKESQAQAGRSETLSQHDKQAEAEQLQFPQTAGQAVALSVASHSHTPALLYCADAANVVQQQHESELSAEKREELSRLVSADEKSRAGERAIGHEDARRRLEEANRLALERQQMLLREYENLEKQLSDAAKMMESFNGERRELEEKLSAKLPGTFAHELLSKQLRSKKAALAEIHKWLAFCSEGKKSLLAMPSSKLLKIVSLSSLLRLGRK